MDCSPPGSSVHGILQARVLEWVAIPFSRGSSQPRDQTQVSCIAGRHFILRATREAHTYAADIIIYVLALPTWGLECGMHRINMEGGKEGGRKRIILPKQIPRVEDILLNKHGFTRKKASALSLPLAPSKILGDPSSMLPAASSHSALLHIHMGHCWNGVRKLGVWWGEDEFWLHLVQWSGIH